MSVVEDLLLRLQTLGFREGTAEVDATAAAVRRTGSAAKEADAKTVGLGKSFGGLKGMAASAAGTIGVGGLAFGLADAVKQARRFQEVQAQLGASIHANVRRPAADATAQMSDFADSLSTKGGFAPNDAIQSMTQFLRVTKDVHQSESDMTLATNVARGAHVDLGRAVRAVMMAEQGRTTGLSRLGVTIKPVTAALDTLHATTKKATAEQIAQAKATDALGTKQQAMAALSKEYGGAMATYSKTSAGGINNLRNSVEVLSVKLGSVLLPVISTFVGWLAKTVGFLDDNKDALYALGAAAAALAVAWGVEKLVAFAGWLKDTVLLTKAWAAATWLVQGATDAWAAIQLVLNGELSVTEALEAAILLPVLLVIAAIVALGVAIYMTVKHWKAIKQAAVDAMHWVVGAIQDAIKWISQHWPLILGILTGPVGLAVEQIVTHFDTVKKIPGEILQLFASAGSAIASAIVWPFKWAFDWVKNHLPHFHSVHVGPVSIPMPSFQTGGPVTATGPYLVGERGPEIVTLPQGGYVHPNSSIGGFDRPIVINNILDGKLMSQSVIRQGLLQTARG